MAVYGYTRVSTARQANEGESLDVQHRQLEGYALMHGLVFNDIVVEEGVSGSVPVTDRPAGGALLAKLRQGDIVIAAKLDRMFRSAIDALTVVEQLKARGIKLHLLDLGGDIAGNGLSKLFLTIAAAFAEAERDRIRERVATVKRDQKDRGRYLGGKVPFGFRVGENGELVPHDNEQEAIQEILALREQNFPLRTISAVVRAKGHQVSHEAVRTIAMNKRIKSFQDAYDDAYEGAGQEILSSIGRVGRAAQQGEEALAAARAAHEALMERVRAKRA